MKPSIEVKPIDIAKTVGMIGAKRFVYIRGYVRQVEVLGRSEHSKKHWHVLEKLAKSERRHLIHEDDFYHRNNGGLLIPRCIEFKRKYPDHDVRIENLPI